MDIFAIFSTLAGWVSGVWWHMFKEKPDVHYIPGTSITSIEIIRNRQVLMIQPRGTLQNDGLGDSTTQNAYIEAKIGDRNYKLDVETGWNLEFIGRKIAGRGRQLPIYPGFFVYLIPEELTAAKNEPIRATLKVCVWRKKLIEYDLGSLWVSNK